MILIGVGSNLGSPQIGGPLDTCEHALKALHGTDVKVVRRSRWYRSAPVPPSDQPWFVNAVAEVETALPAPALLDRLHAVERALGRRRRARNEARAIDLDLLAYDDQVVTLDGPLELPHPRMAERAFVLLPLAELAPDWRHPVSGEPLDALIAALPADQTAEPLDA